MMSLTAALQVAFCSGNDNRMLLDLKQTLAVVKEVKLSQTKVELLKSLIFLLFGLIAQLNVNVELG